MNKFSHRYAAGYRVRYRLAPGGGQIADTFIISSAVPLDSSDPAFDQQKANDLEAAAVAYSKSLGNPYRSIELEYP